ncbi:ATP-binding protein [Streptomyces sp. SID5606]|uniref:ATP-binding protein n=1 Tax=Streptomyces sp. SID5606 TaxID=2690305 RepID=UPI001369B910|nr:ATP-binding protein [Streptomyces sp. SID5606]MZD58814.1 ATP-binding protein [Streptomyces sp. SID5606]
MPDEEVSGRKYRSVLPFTAVPAEVRLLRRTAAVQLGRWGLSDGVEEAELVVTELATNVIKHVGDGTSATLVLEWDGDRLRVEIHDKSQAVPSLSAACCDDECGRGLHLLAAVAADWGTALTAAGKSVWCEITVGAGGTCRRMARAAQALRNYSTEAVPALEGRLRETVLKESAVELIADLLHWTAAGGFDPDDILDQAQLRFDAEPGAAA